MSRSLRFVLVATISDARGSRVLLRNGLAGTKADRRHRTTGGIFIQFGWAVKAHEILRSERNDPREPGDFGGASDVGRYVTVPTVIVHSAASRPHP